MAQPSQVEVDLRACPCCTATRVTVLQSLSMRRNVEESPYYSADFFATLDIGLDDAFQLVECLSCGFVFIGNPATDDVLDKLYTVDDLSLPSHLEVFARPARLAYQLQVYSRVLDAVAARVESDARGVPRGPVNIMDFGAGIGAGILSIVRPGFSFRAFAVESSSIVLDYLRSNGVSAVTGLAEFREEVRFDAIILNDVLEHVKQPISLLIELSRKLKSTGVIWIAVPDFSEGRLKRELEAYRSGTSFNKELNPLEHLSYFSPETLDRAALRAGLCRVRSAAALIQVQRASGFLKTTKNTLRAVRDILRVQSSVEQRFTTADLFEKRGLMRPLFSYPETTIPDLNPCLSKLLVSTPVQGFNFLFRNN